MAHVTFPFTPAEADRELAAWVAERLELEELVVLAPCEPVLERPRLPRVQAALWVLGDLAEGFAGRVLQLRRVPSDLARTVTS
jgi:hypothetical protein